jgi:DNA-binding response OmpR family regulator
MLARPLIDTAWRRQQQEVDYAHLQHVLLVEDDPDTRRTVTHYFATHDVSTTAASTRTELERYLAAGEPALIILGQRLGKDNGLDLLRSIRASSDVPIIIAGRHGVEEIDCVVGLELGADDYIGKPFQLRELLARVRAILRRHKLGQASKARGPRLRAYTFDGWRLELATRRLTDPDGRPVALTRGEYALLLAFLEAPQRPLQREQLLQSTRAHEDIFDRSVDVQILRLRRKLEDDLAAPRMILTERGIGYSFALRVRSL